MESLGGLGAICGALLVLGFWLMPQQALLALLLFIGSVSWIGFWYFSFRMFFGKGEVMIFKNK